MEEERLKLERTALPVSPLVAVKILKPWLSGCFFKAISIKKGNNESAMAMAKRSFFDSPLLASKCKRAVPDKKEKIFGYLIGPIGGQLLYFLIQTWLNIYYTDVLGLTSINKNFLFYFPLISGVAVVLFNLLFGYLIDRTRTKQGKARPYILLSAFLLPLSGALLFAIPENNPTAEYVLICLSFNLFFAIAYAIYNTSYNLLVPLSSRNSKSRNVLSTLSNIGMAAIIKMAIEEE